MRTKDDLADETLRRKARERFAVAERLEAEYLRSLRQLTRQIDKMVKGMAPPVGTIGQTSELQAMLRQYSVIINPWARTIANKILYRIAQREENAWIQLGRDMGKSLREELQSAPTGATLRGFLNEQVRLITSLPVEAAERVHTLTLEGIVDGTRAREISKEILRTGEVTESRARLIARTEVARTAAGLTMARAQHVGATHYIWRTSKDMDVRESHKKMDGKIVAFDSPPTLEDGSVTHAGMIYNCRCYIQPILPDL